MSSPIAAAKARSAASLSSVTEESVVVGVPDEDVLVPLPPEEDVERSDPAPVPDPVPPPSAVTLIVKTLSSVRPVESVVRTRIEKESCVAMSIATAVLRMPSSITNAALSASPSPTTSS